MPPSSGSSRREIRVAAIALLCAALSFVGCRSQSDEPVTYYLNRAASDTTVRAVARAFDAWEASGEGPFRNGGTNDAGIRYDGRNTVSFLLEWPEDVPFGHVAYTALWYDRRGRIVEADIICNMRLVNFTTRETNSPDACYVEDVVAHEIGHMLGFAHSDDPASVMHPDFSAGEMRSLDAVVAGLVRERETAFRRRR